MNQREQNLLNARLKKLSHEINKENKKPKAQRNQERIGKAKLRMHEIKMWLDPAKELKRIEPMMRAVYLQTMAEAKRHRNPFDQLYID